MAYVDCDYDGTLSSVGLTSRWSGSLYFDESSKQYLILIPFSKFTIAGRGTTIEIALNEAEHGVALAGAGRHA